MTVQAVREQLMPWDDYEALGEDVRGEYIDGRLVVSPRPSRIHQRAVHRLVALLDGAVPGCEAVAEWAWKPGTDEYHPDVMLVPHGEEVVRFTGTPLLCVEVLSTNRSDDLVRKTQRYARAGLPHYWILDPQEPSLRCYDLRPDGLYEQTSLVLDRGIPAGWEVEVDLARLLGA